MKHIFLEFCNIWSTTVRQSSVSQEPIASLPQTEGRAVAVQKK